LEQLTVSLNTTCCSQDGDILDQLTPPLNTTCSIHAADIFAQLTPCDLRVLIHTQEELSQASIQSMA
jgi:hypothetical protein